MNSRYPLARKDKLVVRELGEEVLVYDLVRDKAFCLNRLAGAVWKQSDGKKSAAQIAETLSRDFEASVAEEAVWSAIDQLERDHLFEYCIPKPSKDTRVTRRSQLKYMTSAAALVPAVAALTAPKASAAQSCRPANSACTPGSIPCCNGNPCMQTNGKGAFKCKG